jgi:hypothetical protein
MSRCVTFPVTFPVTPPHSHLQFKPSVARKRELGKWPPHSVLQGVHLAMDRRGGIIARDLPTKTRRAPLSTYAVVSSAAATTSAIALVSCHRTERTCGTCAVLSLEERSMSVVVTCVAVF